MDTQVVGVSIPNPIPVSMAQGLSESIEYYLKQICGINGVDYTLLDKTPYHGVTDKREVNRLFFAAMPKHTPVAIAPAQRKALQELFAKRGDIGGRLKTDYETRKNYYLDTVRLLDSRMAEMLNAKKKWQNAANMDSAHLVAPVEKLLSEGKVNLDMASAVDGILSFTTKNSIVLRHKDTDKKIDITVDMGKYKIYYYVTDSKVRVFWHEDNITVGANIHPHVSSEGKVCWGNAADAIASALESCDVQAVVNTTLLLLSEYNDESPYVSLYEYKLETEYLPSKRLHVLKRELSAHGLKDLVHVYDTYSTDSEHVWVVYVREHKVTGKQVLVLHSNDMRDVPEGLHLFSDSEECEAYIGENYAD